MSAILESVEPILTARFFEVTWDNAPRVTLFSEDHAAVMDPDTARALGLALIEAAGLALGAWGQAQSDRADEALAEHAQETADRRAAIRSALGRHQPAPDIVEVEP